jgi:lipopolysaccharide/colanic/teichoic acid biosynthesis glycosyltransferase
MSEVEYSANQVVPSPAPIWHPNLSYPFFKRALDIFFALSFLLLFAIPMLLIALGIKLHSPGPVFYRQQRIGKRGRPFTMLKFRSMRIANDSSRHCQHVLRLIIEDASPKDLGVETVKIKADPRITGMGKILRNLSLDELPQLFNVLKGEMSLVGPRPPLPYEYAVYSDWHKTRLDVLPGITGVWQVTAHNTVSFSEMVRIDLEYIQEMNLLLDLKIMLLTPLAMIKGKGAG